VRTGAPPRPAGAGAGAVLRVPGSSVPGLGARGLEAHRLEVPRPRPGLTPGPPPKGVHSRVRRC